MTTDVAATLSETLSELPPRARSRTKAELLRTAATQLLDVVMDDPESYTESSLAGLYHAAASGQTARFKLVRETTARGSATKVEIIRRLELARRLADHPVGQKAVVEEFAADPKQFFDNWVWMVDPRRPGLKLIPFVLFDKQREIVDFIDEHRRLQRSCMIEKTRDFGVSVIAIGMGVDYWLTLPSSIVGYGSRKEALVHKMDDVDSLLEKARLIIRHLPVWMLPDGYDENKHFNYMNIVNPDGGSQMKGEGGEELGRGGRATIFFADEFPKVKNQQKSHQSLSGTTECAVYFGTSGGVNTYFYRMKASNAYPMMSVPWYWDPRKLDKDTDVGNPKADSVWKRAKMKELLNNEAAFAQEFGCDDSRSLESIVIAPEWVQAAVTISLSTGSETVCGVDLATTGADETVMAIRRGAVVDPMECWRNLEVKESAARVAAHGNAKGVQYLYYDRSGLGSGFQGPMEDLAPTFEFRGVNGQVPADKFVRYDDDPSKPAVERFRNKITELWWSLRRRFYRTWEHFHGIETYPDDELISIPNDPVLIMQLSARQYFTTGTGKIQLEDKKKMEVSPDRADALAHAEETFLQRRKRTNSDAREAEVSKTRDVYEW